MLSYHCKVLIFISAFIVIIVNILIVIFWEHLSVTRGHIFKEHVNGPRIHSYVLIFLGEKMYDCTSYSGPINNWKHWISITRVKKKRKQGGKWYLYGSLTFSKLLCKLQSSDTFPTGGAACCAHQVEKRNSVVAGIGLELTCDSCPGDSSFQLTDLTFSIQSPVTHPTGWEFAGQGRNNMFM